MLAVIGATVLTVEEMERGEGRSGDDFVASRGLRVGRFRNVERDFARLSRIQVETRLSTMGHARTQN